jgi:hypothetical protein
MTEDIRLYDEAHRRRLEALAEAVQEWALARQKKREEMAAHNELIKQIEERIETLRYQLQSESSLQMRLPIRLDVDPETGEVSCE